MGNDHALRAPANDQPLTPVVVGIATTGRPGIVSETVAHLGGLQDRPDRVVICIADPDDFDPSALPDLPFPLDVLTSAKGLCEQRNTLLDNVGDASILLFLDDDFLLAEGYVSATRNRFDTNQDVVMTTGTVLADGILGPGYDHETGVAFLAQAQAPQTAGAASEVYNGYGCNMAVRTATVAAQGLRFDTVLPRYGWLEDVDFSRRLAQFGRILKCPDMMGVHLGTKTGRSRGLPLGYSQIANPVYMIRKGTMSPRRALRLMLRNMLANLAKALHPEPWVDRRGRVRGNLIALGDLIRGRLSPQRILEL